VSILEFSGRLRYASGFVVQAEFATEARVTALVGPSGGGKTSILSMIAGLRRPDCGRICLAGRLLDDTACGLHVAPEARRIGYVFQGQMLFPHRSVRQNLLYGWKRRAATARPVELAHVVAVLELEPMLERLPHTLSGGERQRVALGRALMCGPELLLLDEPLASLDEPLKERVIQFVERVLDEWQIPVIYVSHSTNEVQRLAQHVVQIEQGRVVDRA
jgi:molybdate transport system ATP-binding protein